MGCSPRCGGPCKLLCQLGAHEDAGSTAHLLKVGNAQVSQVHPANDHLCSQLHLAGVQLKFPCAVLGGGQVACAAPSQAEGE